MTGKAKREKNQKMTKSINDRNERSKKQRRINATRSNVADSVLMNEFIKTEEGMKVIEIKDVKDIKVTMTEKPEDAGDMISCYIDTNIHPQLFVRSIGHLEAQKHFFQCFESVDPVFSLNVCKRTDLFVELIGL